MTDQELVFKALKREGDCWHKGSVYKEAYGKRRFGCSLCGSSQRNPDFSTPDGFFWMWERLKEKAWWGHFLYKIWPELNPEVNGWSAYGIPITLINPITLYNAVLEWVKTKEE